MTSRCRFSESARASHGPRSTGGGTAEVSYNWQYIVCWPDTEYTFPGLPALTNLANIPIVGHDPNAVIQLINLIDDYRWADVLVIV